MDFHTRLKELREELNITQATLGKDLGVTQSRVADWETKRGRPDIEMLKQLSDYFMVSIDFLVGREYTVCENCKKRI
ncbi:MAG: helix-turn-helix domain-containing protein [Firmicutes bacterium]|nr:helix-turn-helix domain-containing protein [Bacillota bacterium]